ncbi:histidinol-phosphatase HisJ family protein [Spirochaetota bacterium]
MDLVNYHTHTYLCEHATGTIDEYIACAIDAGIKELGFSDHSPLPENFRKGYTMSAEKIEFYIDEIEKRKLKYKDKISIKLGIEIDFPLIESFDKKYLDDNRFDYLIGSCHFIEGWSFDHPDYLEEFKKRDIDDIYSQYYEIMDSMAESGLFDIIAHFDLIKKYGHMPKNDFSKKIEEIAKKIAQSETAVEINTSGLLKPVKEIYPSESIIKIMFKNNVPVTLSTDSHSPEHVGFMLKETIEMLKKIGYRKISGFTKRKRYDIII